jgi:hypothetical protein
MELSLENFLIVIDKGKGFISISDGLYLKDLELSFWDRIIWKEASHFGIIRESYYSRPSDFSWWNLLYNIKLSYHLKTKAILAISDSHVYDLETPFIEGILTETWAKDIKDKWLIMMTFELKNKYKNIPYSISFAGYGEDKFNKAKVLLSTIRPIEDIEEGYKEIEDIYKKKERSQYPEEVLLLSMMSINGVTRENLEELVEIMERKNYSQYTIDDIKKQLKSFRH